MYGPHDPLGLFAERIRRLKGGIMNLFSHLVFLFIAALTLGGCEIAADIFKAGVWVGVVLVVVIVGGIIWMVSKSRA